MVWNPDHRSYKVSFEKIEKLGFRAEKKAKDGVLEIVKRLESGALDKTKETITLDWYRDVIKEI